MRASAGNSARPVEFFPSGGTVIVTTEGHTRSTARPVASLAVAMLGFFVISLDAQIVNVTLPDTRESFGGGLSGLQ